MKQELRKFICPKGHLFFAPIWVNYLDCPMFCDEKADNKGDIKGNFPKRIYKGLGSGLIIKSSKCIIRQI